MAEVEIAGVEATPRGCVGVHPGIPFAALHQHRRVGDQRVAADMVEVKMRVDDEVDLAGIAVDRFEPRAHLFARLKADPEQLGEPWAEPPGGVVLAIGAEPGVEQRPALGMFDQKDRDRHGDVALATLHQTGELAGYRAAGECVEPDRHRRLRSLFWPTFPGFPWFATPGSPRRALCTTVNRTP
jgi:hypothetical protein